MPESVTKLPPQQDIAPPSIRRMTLSEPFAALHKEVDRIFDEFTRDFGRRPLSRRFFEAQPLMPYESSFGIAAPVVDVVEKEAEYQISAELPGLEEKDVEVGVADDVLTIKGEKKEEKEEKTKNYHLSERRYGAFQRSFQLPSGVAKDRIEARFQKGVLTVTLPKTPEAQKREQKIEIKTK
ncbi:MAG TPA: Hsp20/alpha crystallin family protein [Candidatus Acidoferrum sp.]|nr:Hsp20/alpha crystallin family protein [Candidatus Acidoferrum sp.]